MKPVRITAFVLFTVLCLGLLSCLVPENGVSISGMNLRFPSASDIQLKKCPYSKQLEDISNFESRQQRLARVMEEESEFRSIEARYLEAISRYDNIISLPDSSYDYFDRFFRSLDNAEAEHLRVAYYGDSQLEEDRMTNVLRDSLQARFGGAGVGLVPAAMEYCTMSLNQVRNYMPQRARINASKDFWVKNNSYGPCFMVTRISSPYHCRYMPSILVKDNRPSKSFTRIKVLADSIARLDISAADAEAIPDSTLNPMRRYVIDYDRPVATADLDIKGYGDIYGVMLDGENGVSVDNISLRGVAGNFFTNMDRDQLRDYLVNENVRLVILQYGCNKVPALTSKAAQSRYGQEMYEQIMLFKELAPEATILFNGPQDMKYYHFMQPVVDTLKHYALKAGVAYWSMYDAMGGDGSMTEWQSKGFAVGDGIHFTQKGASQMSSILFKSLMAYYDYYRWRN